MKKTLALSAFVLLSTAAFAEEMPVLTLTVKDHVFTPDTLEMPANKKIKLVIKNLDKTPEEFESHDLNREKIIPANGEVKIFLGPLSPGEYKFFGEFNPATAHGQVIVK